MAECCEPFIQSFVGQDQVTVNYSPSMLASYGSRPRVDVLLQDEATGEFVLTDFLIRKALVGFPNTSQVIVYVGGPGTGLIKIS